MFVVVRYLCELRSVGGMGAKPVLITGCDSGFGQMLAVRLVGEGVPVFAGCLTDKGAEELKRRAGSANDNLTIISLDVTSQESMDAAKKVVEEKLNGKGLWGLVNNAGIAGDTGFDDFTTVADYQKCFDVNTLGVIRTTHAFKSLVKKCRGRIVTVASVLGRIGQPGTGPYTVSKHAVEGYMECLRQEMHNFGVKVMVLEPGYFKTNLTDAGLTNAMFTRMWNRVSDDTRQEYGQQFYDKGHFFGVKVMVLEPGYFKTNLTDAGLTNAMFTRMWNRVSDDTRQEYGQQFYDKGHFFGVKVMVLEPGYFKTNLTDAGLTNAMFTRMWNRVSDDTRQEYGQQFYDKGHFFGVKVMVLEPGYFKTNLTDAGLTNAMFTRMWNRVSDDTRQEYGQQFYDKGHFFGVKVMVLEPGYFKTNLTDAGLTNAMFTRMWNRVSDDTRQEYGQQFYDKGHFFGVKVMVLEPGYFKTNLTDAGLTNAMFTRMWNRVSDDTRQEYGQQFYDKGHFFGVKVMVLEPGYFKTNLTDAGLTNAMFTRMWNRVSDDTRQEYGQQFYDKGHFFGVKVMVLEPGYFKTNLTDAGLTNAMFTRMWNRVSDDTRQEYGQQFYDKGHFFGVKVMVLEPGYFKTNLTDAGLTNAMFTRMWNRVSDDTRQEYGQQFYDKGHFFGVKVMVLEPGYFKTNLTDAGLTNAMFTRMWNRVSDDTRQEYGQQFYDKGHFFGVKVMVLEPGYFKTNLTDAGLTNAMFTRMWNRVSDDTRQEYGQQFYDKGHFFGVKVMVLEPGYFKTNLTDAGLTNAMFTRMWNRVSDDTRQEYGQQFYDKGHFFGVKVMVLEPGYFKTNLTDAGLTNAMFTRMWNRVSDDTRQEYGQQFYDKGHFFGVKVMVLEPGYFKTNLTDAGLTNAMFTRMWNRVSDDTRQEYGQQFYDKGHFFGVKVMVLEPGYFKTNLTDAGLTNAMFTRMWNRVSDDTRQEYGQQFYDKVINNVPKLLSSFASPRTDFVIDAYHHALTAAFPRDRYHVGWDSICFFIPVSICPTWLSDALFRHINIRHDMPKPAASIY